MPSDRTAGQKAPTQIEFWRATLIVLALGLLAVVIGSIDFTLGVEKGHADASERRVQTLRHDAEEIIREECSSETGQDFVTCVEGTLQIYRESERAEYDLVAQQQMADLAWWMLLFTAVSKLIGAAGVIYVAANLAAARDAVKQAASGAEAAQAAATETARSAEAAREANTIARQSVLDQDRPYVLIEVLQSNFRDWYQSSDTDFVWPYRIKNFGRGPALLRSIEYNCVFGASLDLALARDGYWLPERIAAPTPMGMVENKILGEMECTRDFQARGRRKSLWQGFEDEHFIWLLVRVRYADVHGREFETVGCYRQQHTAFVAQEDGGPKYNCRRQLRPEP